MWYLCVISLCDISDSIVSVYVTCDLPHLRVSISLPFISTITSESQWFYIIVCIVSHYNRDTSYELICNKPSADLDANLAAFSNYFHYIFMPIISWVDHYVSICILKMKWFWYFVLQYAVMVTSRQQMDIVKLMDLPFRYKHFLSLH